MPTEHIKHLHALGLNVFPAAARKKKDKWVKWVAIPGEMSWKSIDIENPLLDWSSGMFGVEVPKDVLVIDLDVHKGVSSEQVDALLGAQLNWQDACIQRTINGGYHFAFYCPWKARQGDSLEGLSGFDTRAAQRGLIFSGAGYEYCGDGVARLAAPIRLPSLPDVVRRTLEVHERELPPPKQGVNPTELISEALSYLDPGCSRSEWFRTMAAMRNHFADDPLTGRDMFVRWSSGDLTGGDPPANYVPEGPGSPGEQWMSISPSGGINASTLFYQAMQAGWAPPPIVDLSGVFAKGADHDVFTELVTEIREVGGDAINVPGMVSRIREAGCDSLQTALLAAEIKQAMKDSGLGSRAVGKAVDDFLAPAKRKRGVTPVNGYVDSHLPLSSDVWAPHHTTGRANKPRGTIENVRILLKSYGVNIEFDEVLKTLKVSGPSIPSSGTLKDEAALGLLDSLANLNDLPTVALRSLIPAIANDNVVNPVKDWVGSAPWDGEDHVGELWRQITLDPDEDHQFCEILFRKWLRGAYSIGTGLISRWEFVLVLIEPMGGAGKTRFFATLCPPELQTDSRVLDVNNKDSVKMLVSYWLTELGELDGTFSKAEHARLKAFLSMRTDELRPPYGRAYMKYPRRTAFFSSVNKEDYLIDQSANRRWWGMRVVDVNYTHKVNVQQAWAQAAAEVGQGLQAHLTPQEEQTLIRRNEGHRETSPVADALGRLPLRAVETGGMTSSEVLAHAGYGKPSRADLSEAARVLTRWGFRKGSRGRSSVFFVSVEDPTFTSNLRSVK